MSEEELARLAYEVGLLVTPLGENAVLKVARLIGALSRASESEAELLRVAIHLRDAIRVLGYAAAPGSPVASSLALAEAAIAKAEGKP